MEAKSVLQKTLESYGGLEDIALSFNGGKDCTVLLHLLSTVLPGNSRPIDCIYVPDADSFVEVEEFITYCIGFYNLNLVRFDGVDIKSALSTYLRDNPNKKAILMGTRQSDPYSSISCTR